MVRLPLLFLFFGFILAVAGCGQTASNSQNKQSFTTLTAHEKIKLTAYNNVQAVINHDGRLLCQTMTFTSIKKMIELGRSKGWPGSGARSDREQRRNCPKVATSFINEINKSKSQRIIYRKMARQIVRSHQIRISRNNKKKVLIAQIIIPRLIIKNGKVITDPDNQKNTLALEYGGNGRWLTSQCKWGVT